MFFRQILNDETTCASHIFGCNSAGELAVVDPHEDLFDEYVDAAEAQGSRITAVLETHVQADHVSGPPDHLLVHPAHSSGSVCGRGLSGSPASTIGFERRHNTALGFESEQAFVDALIEDIPPKSPSTKTRSSQRIAQE